MKTVHSSLSVLVGAYVIVTAGLAAQTQTPPTRTREMLISVIARVEHINLTTREVTLKESTAASTRSPSTSASCGSTR
jgi:hypothetical protein